MNIEYRAPRNETELDDTIECSLRAFGDSGDRRYRFTNIVKQDPWFDLNNTRACFVDGKGTSVVQIFDRPMRIGRLCRPDGGSRQRWHRSSISSRRLFIGSAPG